jgi:hypothetical protein
MPQRQHRGGTHATVREQIRKPIQVLAFLLLHLSQYRGRLAPLQHRKLAGVDARRAIFAGVIHAKHARNTGLMWRIAGKPPSRVVHAALLSRQRKMPRSIAKPSA